MLVVWMSKQGLSLEQSRSNSCIGELPLLLLFVCSWLMLTFEQCIASEALPHSWRRPVTFTLTHWSNASHRDVIEVTSSSMWVHCALTPDNCWQAAAHHKQECRAFKVLVLQQSWPNPQHFMRSRAWNWDGLCLSTTCCHQPHMQCITAIGLPLVQCTQSSVNPPQNVC